LQWNEAFFLSVTRQYRKIYPSSWKISSLECKNGRDDTSVREAGAQWFPEKLLQRSELESDSIDSIKADLELQSLQLMASLFVALKNAKHSGDNVDKNQYRKKRSRFWDLCYNRFKDLCCSRRGELILEQLFEGVEEETETRIVIGAITSLQSLLVLGMQYGAKARSLTLAGKTVSNSMDCEDSQLLVEWDTACTQKLKSECNRLPGMNLLAVMKRKRSPQGAFDVLVDLGIWQADEDLSLLRSGLPIRFSDDEIHAAEKVIPQPQQVQFLELCPTLVCS